MNINKDSLHLAQTLRGIVTGSNKHQKQKRKQILFLHKYKV